MLLISCGQRLDTVEMSKLSTSEKRTSLLFGKNKAGILNIIAVLVHVSIHTHYKGEKMSEKRDFTIAIP